MTSTDRAGRAGYALAAATAVLGLIAVTASLWLDLAVEPADRRATHMRWGLISACIGMLLCATAVPVLARLPRHPVGWVLGLEGLIWAWDGVAESWVTFAVTADPDLPGAGFAFWFVEQFGSILMVGLPLLFLLYPTGRLLPGAWRTVSVAVLTMALSLPLTLCLAPAELLLDRPLPVEPLLPGLPVDAAAYEPVLLTTRTLAMVAIPLSVVILFVRQRRADARERQQIRWLLWAGLVTLLMGAFGMVVPTGNLITALLVAALATTGASVAIGLIAPDLTDVDALIGGTLVHAAAAGAVLAVDLLLLGVLDATMGEQLTERDTTLLLLLVAVVLYGPLRTLLAAAVRRLLVGRRGDRYGVLAQLAARLEQTDDVRTQLPALASAVATTFKLDFVRVEVFGHTGGTLSATRGEEPVATRELRIRYGGEDIGRLVLPARGVRSMLSRRDQELLFDVVRQGAMAVRSARLARELQVSREQLVLDREEDRRRIRRDLHDGLGPVLSGVAMRLDAVANAIRSDPDTALRMVEQSRGDITEGIRDVRRLVHGLRPPALDDLGLVAALQQQVDRLGASSLSIDLESRDLPPLPAAVEVAAFRIASEALTNVARHSGARTCRVVLAGLPDTLLVEVGDDGRGIDPDVPAGVGLRSVRERADELGGRTEVVCPPGGGTTVRAWLPVTTLTPPTADLAGAPR